MTGRILRIEIHRSAALWVAAGTALLGAALLYVAVGGWGGRWMLLALWQREYLFILWPMALGLGAWHAGRDRRCRTDELISTTARPRWQRVLPAAAAMALSAAAGYVLMYATGAAQVAALASYLPGQSVVLAGVGVLWMVSGAWLGMAVGALVPSRLTPAVTAVVGAAVAMVAITDRGYSHVPKVVHLLTPSPFGFWGDFVTVTGRVSVAHTVWLVGLAVTGLAGFVCATRGTRLVALLPAAVAAVTALALLPADRQRLPVPDPAAAAPVCESGPRVCVTRVHATALADLREPARQALATLAAKLPQAPTSVRETPVPWYEAQARARPHDTLLVELELDPWGGTKATPDELRWRLLDGAGTRPCTYILGKPDAAGAHHTARLAAAAWLVDAPPPSGEYGDAALRAWEKLRSLPATEQRARVAALREAALACVQVNLLDVLVGDAR
ncbi:hypothetical protein GA0070616_0437 [Micromonospora nigra]|uniref:Uncharacterized protein n=1 Tax=Micromonospora nigra TaxID=145857 RepID=A0A1C6RB94_9ACTN|nr:hypothetical protein [Micromonospora nigra]SCL14428.1 hypothetical protein GA0070616_0437 [Micromonospora nigra]